MSEGKTTTDHDEIREWAEQRGGVPATVKGTERGKGKSEEAGILRLDFEPRDEGLEEISWEEFFEKFDKEKLAFLYQEETADGSTSRFHKFVNRPAGQKSSSKAKSGGGKSASASAGKSSGGTKSPGGKSAGSSKSRSGTSGEGKKTASTKS